MKIPGRGEDYDDEDDEELEKGGNGRHQIALVESLSCCPISKACS